MPIGRELQTGLTKEDVHLQEKRGLCKPKNELRMQEARRRIENASVDADGKNYAS